MNDARTAAIDAVRVLQAEGRDEEALLRVRQALMLAPRDDVLLTLFGAVLARLERWREAATAYEQALAVDGSSAEAASGAGRALAAFGDLAGARGMLERALALAPEHVEARATLANLLARTGDWEDGRREAEATLARSPGHTTALAALAAADVGAGKFDLAEQRLRFMLEPLPPGAGLSPLLHAACLHLLADALHGQQRASEAFEFYLRGKDELRRVRASLAPVAEQFVDSLTRCCDYFDRASPVDWRARDSATPAASPVRGHVFLVGFHRSGTTLLEQVLAAHPDLVTLEERNLLGEPAARFLRHAGGLQALARIDEAGAARQRDAYWQRVRATGTETDGKIFVDKMPLDTVNLPLVAKFFPEARVLFARRDPRDVVLSVFRHMFAADGATYQMLTLEGAAQLYDLVMRLADNYRRVLPLAVHEVRYERFVTDFGGETRMICAFLGVPADDAMWNFASLARGRAIATPSAGQVRRGLYRLDEAPWRAYADQLAPVMPTLAPWVKRFGYPAV